MQRTFDFVTIQLYEGYSHAEYNTTQRGQSPAEYVVQWVQKVLAGWEIDYTGDKELDYPVVSTLLLDRTQLVIGNSNGWAGDGKFFLLYPDEVRGLSAVSGFTCSFFYRLIVFCFGKINVGEYVPLYKSCIQYIRPIVFNCEMH